MTDEQGHKTTPLRAIILLVLLTLMGLGLIYMEDNPQSIPDAVSFLGVTPPASPSPVTTPTATATSPTASPLQTPGISAGAPQTSSSPTVTPQPTPLAQPHSVRVRGGDDEDE